MDKTTHEGRKTKHASGAASRKFVKFTVVNSNGVDIGARVVRVEDVLSVQTYKFRDLQLSAVTLRSTDSQQDYYIYTSDDIDTVYMKLLACGV